MAKITNKNDRDWKAEPLPKRLQRCRAMLKIYGLLTTKESARICQKIAASA
jgi:hypothetical protein